MKPYRDKLLAIFDTETTGLSPDDHEIIEMAVMLYNPQTDQVQDEWEVKCAPRHIETASEEALKINGFNKNASLYTKDIKSSVIKLNNLVDDCMFMGQNIPFDVAFLHKYLKEFNVRPKFDRRYVELASMAWPYVLKHNLNGLSLKDLCEHFNISNVGAHGALVDCQRTLSVYRALIGIYK